MFQIRPHSLSSDVDLLVSLSSISPECSWSFCCSLNIWNVLSLLFASFSELCSIVSLDPIVPVFLLFVPVFKLLVPASFVFTISMTKPCFHLIWHLLVPDWLPPPWLSPVVSSDFCSSSCTSFLSPCASFAVPAPNCSSFELFLFFYRRYIRHHNCFSAVPVPCCYRHVCPSSPSSSVVKSSMHRQEEPISYFISIWTLYIDFTCPHNVLYLLLSLLFSQWPVLYTFFFCDCISNIFCHLCFIWPLLCILFA